MSLSFTCMRACMRVSVRVHECMHHHTYVGVKGQHAVVSSMWVPGIRFGLSGMAAGTLTRGSCLADPHLGFFCVPSYIHLSWLGSSSRLSRWAMRAERCLHYCPDAFAEPCGVLGRMETVFSINTFMHLKITAS